MADTMMIQSKKKLAGGPLPGEVGEVDAAYGQMLVDKGHAIDVTELVNRTELSDEERLLSYKVDELRDELEARGLSKSGKKTELVRRILEDDEAPSDLIDGA